MLTVNEVKACAAVVAPEVAWVEEKGDEILVHLKRRCTPAGLCARYVHFWFKIPQDAPWRLEDVANIVKAYAEAFRAMPDPEPATPAQVNEFIAAVQEPRVGVPAVSSVISDADTKTADGKQRLLYISNQWDLP